MNLLSSTSCVFTFLYIIFTILDTEVIRPAITAAHQGPATVYDEINENDMENEYDILKYKYQKESNTYMEPIDNAPYMRITNP